MITTRTKKYYRRKREEDREAKRNQVLKMSRISKYVKFAIQISDT
jgi:hypothetical protein